MKKILNRLPLSLWLAGLLIVEIVAIVWLTARADAQTAYTPHFTLVDVLGGMEITHDQTFDYGAYPPARIIVQNHNGAGVPDCQFSATSDHGSAQYQGVGGNNGYDTFGGYVQPRPVEVNLSVPVVFTLKLNCYAAGTVTAIVTTELPPPPPPPPPTIAPVVKPAPTVAAPAPSPVVKPVAPTPTVAKASVPAPPLPPVVKPLSSSPVAVVAKPTPIPSPALPTLASTPIALISTPILSSPIVETPPPSLSPTHSPSASSSPPDHPSLSPRALSHAVSHSAFPWTLVVTGILVIAWLVSTIWWLRFRRVAKT